MIVVGQVFESRYRVLERIARGFAAEVFKVVDLRTATARVLKIHSADGAFRDYTEHLRDVDRRLAGTTVRHLLRPLDAGTDAEGHYWEIFEFLEAAETLDDAINLEPPLPPGTVLDIVSQIAGALSALHQRSIVHADIKPSNVLFVPSTGRVSLIDFGMARAVGDDVTIVGTYRYLHPELRAAALVGDQSGFARVRVRGVVGEYLDVYALGILALQLLGPGDSDLRSATTQRLRAGLVSSNHFLAIADSALVDAITDLVHRMIRSSPTEVAITAAEVERIASRLSRAFPASEPVVRIEKAESTFLEGSRLKSDTAAIRFAAGDLERVTQTLAEQTAAMVWTATQLKELASTDRENDMAAHISATFDHASSRVRTSWYFGVAMTVLVFLILTSMVVASVTIGIQTGKSGWTLVFGGLSSLIVLATLLWRPFEKLFQATILAQQIEMLHVQTITTFKGTADINKRIEVCQDAVTSLGTLLEIRRTQSTRKRPTRAPAKKRNL